jgi:Spy/CpxP family protein refolding chaperone
MRNSNIVFYSIVSALGLSLVLFQSAYCTDEMSSSNTRPSKADPLAAYKATGINASQESKLKELLADFEALTADKGKTMIQLMNEMRAISLQPDANEQIALSKQNEINKVNNQMSDERIKLMFKMRAVLTADQRAKLVKQMQE